MVFFIFCNTLVGGLTPFQIILSFFRGFFVSFFRKPVLRWSSTKMPLRTKSSHDNEPCSVKSWSGRQWKATVYPQRHHWKLSVNNWNYFFFWFKNYFHQKDVYWYIFWIRNRIQIVIKVQHFIEHNIFPKKKIVNI